MSKFDPTSPVNDDLIDQVVDGVLTPAKLRAAIDRLDLEPDGWKRCGLAFLEAQCWRASLEGFGQSGISRAPGTSLRLPTGRSTSSVRRWIRGATAAGIAAAAFAFGWVSHAPQAWPGLGRTTIAQSGAKPITAANSSQPDGPRTSKVDQRAMRELVASRPVEKPSLPTVNDVIRAVGRLHIGTRSAGADVPILAGPGINEDWLRKQPPPVTESGQVALARAGYHVDQRRRFIMTTLADGRRVAVPVDQVQIRYTGNDPL